MGALSNLWVGDRLGRRQTIALGGCIMIIGAILQTTSYSYAQLVVARIVTGIGNGLNVSTPVSSLFLRLHLASSTDLYGSKLSCRTLVCCETRRVDID